jgi:glycosyltransferase involved in cell wall biosynthesis
VPCFNAGSTLTAALRSALAQSEPPELIVVDDGSSDPATLALLDDTEARGIRVLHQDNRGPGAARMAGVRAARTEYVFTLDADDLLAPGTLCRLADALDRDRGAAFAWGNYAPFGAPRPVRITARALDPWSITYWNAMPALALFRRDALLATGGWTHEPGYEDWDLWMTFAERGRHGVHVPDITYHYRLGRSGRYGRDLQRHEQLLVELRERHAPLFAARSRTRRGSTAPWAARKLLPRIEAARLSTRTRALLYGALMEMSLWHAWQRVHCVTEFSAHRRRRQRRGA